MSNRGCLPIDKAIRGHELLKAVLSSPFFQIHVGDYGLGSEAIPLPPRLAVSA